MGIPQPIAHEALVESAAVSSSLSAKDPMSRLEQIKRGALKNDFRKIINKVESGEISNLNTFHEIPVNKGGRAPAQKVKAPAVAGFVPQRTAEDNEALELEAMLYGGGGTRQQRPQPQQDYYQEQYQQGLHYEPQPQIQPQTRKNEAVINEDIYAPPPVDYRAALEKRLKIPLTKNNQVQEVPSQEKTALNNTLFMKKLTELEGRMQEMVMDVSEQIALKLINEMTPEIATEVAKKTAVQTTKNIILEFGKNGKTILVESAKVKRAEVIAADKVKIDGKIYKLTEIKS